MIYLKHFNEGNCTELEILLQIDNGKELEEFFLYWKYKNFDNKFDFNNLIIIDNGSYGLIFTYAGKNQYYKLTYDKNSYLLARKLIGKNFEHLVRIANVDVITNNYTSLFIIEMEECVPIPESVHTVLENVNHEIISYLRDTKSEATDFQDKSNFDKYYTKEHALASFIDYLWEEEKLTEEDMEYLNSIDLINQLAEMKLELQKCGFTKYDLDIHINNVMFRKNTTDLCLIDFLSPKKMKYR